jgi:hypothetical protein
MSMEGYLKGGELKAPKSAKFEAGRPWNNPASRKTGIVILRGKEVKLQDSSPLSGEAPGSALCLSEGLPKRIAQ